MAYDSRLGLISFFNGETGDYLYTISPTNIKLNTYNVTWESQDYSAYRDANGKLHRNPLASRPPKVEFQVRNGMDNEELNEFMAEIRACAFNEHTRKQRLYHAKVYIPEIDDYVEDDVYMVDPTFSIYRIDGEVIYYNSFRMAFIGYGNNTSWSNK